MKKIIEHGRKCDRTWRFSCNRCGCVFDATPDDYKFEFDRNDEYYSSTCPECGCTARSYIQTRKEKSNEQDRESNSECR